MRWLISSLILTVLLLACGESQPRPRDRLAICVQSYVDAETLEPQIEAALREVEETSPYWPPFNVSLELPPEVDQGCPAKPLIYETDQDFPSRLVKRPNYYSIFVYVVTPDDVERYFDSQRWGLRHAEHVCHGDVCSFATDAMYVSSTDLADQDFLSRALRMALGLVGPGDPEVPDYDYH